MIKCFLCGVDYDEKNRYSFSDIRMKDEEEPTTIKNISILKDGERGIAAICPACTRAASFGVAMSSDDMIWNTPIVIESEENNE